MITDNRFRILIWYNFITNILEFTIVLFDQQKLHILIRKLGINYLASPASSFITLCFKGMKFNGIVAY
jgi:hypothetical protein